ncbi:hypothetical protein [Olleya sp. Bg11-27]|uniref:hypothetical protein n=1 Tax=Olleya sp. Bg11-27 TaxID=2058135 RepID=UPI000C308E01|nr:hypothetical protein [Olleya sp. Bg11-27]AUC74918.1 hypothetical protein CW732_04190 [Olleya sp. Bg11-27]
MKIFNVLILLLIFGCNTAEKNIAKKTEVIDMSSGYPIWKMKKNGIDFKFALNTKNDTVKVWTTDKEFITPEGYKIGSEFKDIENIVKSELYEESGNGFFIKLNSGWELSFCEGKTCTDNEPSKNSKVKWIRRK